MQNDLKTFIKWSGNKTRSLKIIKENIPTFSGIYYEPFLGSGAVFLSLRPHKWIINDINKELIDVWSLVKLDPIKLIKSFQKFSTYFKKLSISNKKKECERIIESLNKKDENHTINYLLMKYCSYMGHLLKRNNKYYYSGLELNVQTGNYSFLSDNYYKNILCVNYFLNNSKGKILNKNYTDILLNCKEGDFVFLDPPYIEEYDYQFKYNQNEQLDDIFLINLKKNLKSLDLKKVKWMMTQADTKEIRFLFKEYFIKEYKVYRNKAKTFKNELLIMNYEL